MSGRGDGDDPLSDERWSEPPGDLPTHFLWAAVLDARFTAQVHPTGQRRGRLTLRDTRNRQRLLLSVLVPLSPGSLYGPTLQEVRSWQARAERAVRAQLLYPHEDEPEP